MGKKLIFLDIDGVLANGRSICRSGGRLESQFDYECVKVLNFITDETNAEIVVSSTWRVLGLGKLGRTLRAAGVTGRIIGVTPSLETPSGSIVVAVPRGREIKAYLAGEDDIESFVILDDDDDMESLSERLVRTTYAVGLSWADARRAVAMLGGGRTMAGMNAPVMNAVKLSK